MILRKSLLGAVCHWEIIARESPAGGYPTYTTLASDALWQAFWNPRHSGNQASMMTRRRGFECFNLAAPLEEQVKFSSYFPYSDPNDSH